MCMYLYIYIYIHIYIYIYIYILSCFPPSFLFGPGFSPCHFGTLDPYVAQGLRPATEARELWGFVLEASGPLEATQLSGSGFKRIHAYIYIVYIYICVHIYTCIHIQVHNTFFYIFTVLISGRFRGC